MSFGVVNCFLMVTNWAFWLHCCIARKQNFGPLNQQFTHTNDKFELSYPLNRVSRSLKKGQGGIQKKGTWCALSHSKRAHSVRARAVRKRQKGYFQYNVEKH